MSNLKQLGLAMLMYEHDYDNRLAPASTWMDKLGDYEKHDYVYHCPYVPAENKNQYGYAMKTRLGGLNVDKIKAPEKELTLFDSELLERNANTNLPTYPEFVRHLRPNFCFADGHVHHSETSDSKD